MGWKVPTAFLNLPQVRKLRTSAWKAKQGQLLRIKSCFHGELIELTLTIPAARPTYKPILPHA